MFKSFELKFGTFELVFGIFELKFRSIEHKILKGFRTTIHSCRDYFVQDFTNNHNKERNLSNAEVQVDRDA